MSSAEHNHRFCSVIDISLGHHTSANATGRKERAALLNAAFWGRGAILTVSFLEGDARLHRRVADIARAWPAESGANIDFDFWIANGRDPGKADIRVAFEVGKGSWSFLGRYAKTVAANARTMNLGWMSLGLDEMQARAVVLHEFGHAIGLIHEHLNPAQKIDWNVPIVVADLRRTQGWDDATIAANMFSQYAPGAVFSTDVDPQSIMMYPIPPQWTNNGYSTAFNSSLSVTDTALIREAYGARSVFGRP